MYLATTFHTLYPFMTTILTRGAVGAALYHDQLQPLLLGARNFFRPPGPSGASFGYQTHLLHQILTSDRPTFAVLSLCRRALFLLCMSR